MTCSDHRFGGIGQTVILNVSFHWDLVLVIIRRLLDVLGDYVRNLRTPRPTAIRFLLIMRTLKMAAIIMKSLNVSNAYFDAVRPKPSSI